MEVFIHVCKKDEYLFNKWLKFTGKKPLTELLDDIENAMSDN
jgi:hypothetical protein